TSAFAQIEFGGRAIGLTDPDRLQQPPLITLPAVDVAALIAEDEARLATGVKGPWRFGFNHEVDLGFDQGIWQTLENGDRLWRISIESPDAYSINFEFHEYIVPQARKCSCTMKKAINSVLSPRKAIPATSNSALPR